MRRDLIGRLPRCNPAPRLMLGSRARLPSAASRTMRSADQLAAHPSTRARCSSALRMRSGKSRAKPPSPGLLEDLPADQHPADLARPGADLVELGVAQQAAGRIVVDVAVAAEALDRVERDRGRALGGVED